MTPRPVPGPWLPPPIGPCHVDTTPAEVTWQARRDRCGGDATWRKGKDAARPICTCMCEPEEGADPLGRLPCPHCEDGHGAPNRTAWNVFVGPERDGDGQPVRLWVEPTAGAHVAEEDAWWLWRLIRERDRLIADRPLDLGPDGVPRLAGGAV